MPSKEPFPHDRHFNVKKLGAGLIEYRVIANHIQGTMFNEGTVHIQGIDKLQNLFVQEKFMTELKLMCRKYKDKSVTQLVKFLFHGCKTVPPKQIYESETGLDTRFSKNGLLGQGIYFSDNAEYSHSYAWSEKDEWGRMVYSLFVCFVLVGSSCLNVNTNTTLRLPPLKNQAVSVVDRYDSVMNTTLGHFVIYNNSYQYPAYLVRYTLAEKQKESISLQT